MYVIWISSYVLASAQFYYPISHRLQALPHTAELIPRNGNQGEAQQPRSQTRAAPHISSLGIFGTSPRNCKCSESRRSQESFNYSCALLLEGRERLRPLFNVLPPPLPQRRGSTCCGTALPGSVWFVLPGPCSWRLEVRGLKNALSTGRESAGQSHSTWSESALHQLERNKYSADSTVIDFPVIYINKAQGGRFVENE